MIFVATGNTLFFATAPNAHSAELLPGKRIAVAASFNKVGNRVILYNMNLPDIPIVSDSLYGAHGVVWDSKRDLLWALGTHELRSYTIVEGEKFPKLKLVSATELPDPDGHDLIMLKNQKKLCLSTGKHVWLYDIDKASFEKHPLIGDEAKVKSVSYNGLNKEIAYIKATDENWWGYYIRFAGSNRVVHLPGEKLYKVRWVY